MYGYIRGLILLLTFFTVIILSILFSICLPSSKKVEVINKYPKLEPARNNIISDTNDYFGIPLYGKNSTCEELTIGTQSTGYNTEKSIRIKRCKSNNPICEIISWYDEAMRNKGWEKYKAISEIGISMILFTKNDNDVKKIAGIRVKDLSNFREVNIIAYPNNYDFPPVRPGSRIYEDQIRNKFSEKCF
jgi:hypothetical protein